MVEGYINVAGGLSQVLPLKTYSVSQMESMSKDLHFNPKSMAQP